MISKPDQADTIRLRSVSLIKKLLVSRAKIVAKMLDVYIAEIKGTLGRA